MGVYRYANGDVYEGEFLDDLYHGLGKYTFRASGQCFEGYYELGVFMSPSLKHASNYSSAHF
jgi:hypothetical protein